MRATTNPALREQLGLEATSRIFIINTEGATDPARYVELVGLRPEDVAPATVNTTGEAS